MKKILFIRERETAGVGQAPYQDLITCTRYNKQTQAFHVNVGGHEYLVSKRIHTSLTPLVFSEDVYNKFGLSFGGYDAKDNAPLLRIDTY